MLLWISLNVYLLRKIGQTKADMDKQYQDFFEHAKEDRRASCHMSS